MVKHRKLKKSNVGSQAKEAATKVEGIVRKKKKKMRNAEVLAEMQIDEHGADSSPEQQPAVPVQAAQPVKKLKKKKKKSAFAATENADDKAPAAASESTVGKRKREESITPASLPEATLRECAALGGSSALEAWLKHCSSGLDAIELRTDPGAPCGAAVYAKKSMAKDETAFSISSSALFTKQAACKHDVMACAADLLKKWKEKDTDEFLMSLRLCHARGNKEDHFHSFASHLPEMPAGASAWPQAFRDVLSATSLKKQLAAADDQLDRWHKLLKRLVDAEPKALRAISSVQKSELEAARGLLLSNLVKEDSLAAAVPLSAFLHSRQSPNVAVKFEDGSFRWVCEKEVKKGEQLSLGPGSKGNEELLMSRGLAIEDNRFNLLELSLTYTDPETKSESSMSVQADFYGIPEAVVDKIEEDQNDGQFVALLKAVIVQRSAVKKSLSELGKMLNFNVCKGPLARSRKRSIEDFLQGQLRILDTSLEEMQPKEAEEKIECVIEGEEEEPGSGDELVDVDQEDGPEMEQEEEGPAWKRARRKKN